MQIIVNRRAFLTEMARRFLTQKALAELLDVTPQAVNAIIKGRARPSMETAKKLCDIFGCCFDDLFMVDDLPFAEE